MALEPVALEHIPPSHAVYVALFHRVRNAAFLHQQLLARNAAFEYAFIDASAIVSRRHVLSAVFKSVCAAAAGALKTPNVHSEIVACLSASNNIADAYRRFGISPSTTDLLVVKVTFPTDSTPDPPSRDSIWRHLESNVQGDAVDVSDDNISATTDLSKVRKYYKLNGLNWLDAVEDDNDKRAQTELLVLGAMALRGL